jgi:TonB family protein
MGLYLLEDKCRHFERGDVKDERIWRFWPAAWIFLTVLPGSALPIVPRPHPAIIEQREHLLSRALKRAAEFENVPHVSWRGSCEQVQGPEALMTPDPLLWAGQERKVKVSFIIGVDGHVHSPLILESAGVAGDRRVLDTVRHWRYRPATCNGVPTEIEGKIEFSSR